MAMVPKGLAAWFPGVEKKVAISDKKLLKTPEKAKEENTQEPQASAPPLPAPPSEEKKVAQESQASALSLPAPPSGKKKGRPGIAGIGAVFASTAFGDRRGLD